MEICAPLLSAERKHSNLVKSPLVKRAVAESKHTNINEIVDEFNRIKTETLTKIDPTRALTLMIEPD